MKKAKLLLVTIFILFIVMVAGCGEGTEKKEKEKISADYGNAEAFEAALNNGDDVEGAIVVFEAGEVHPESALGFNVWAGEHLNFVSDKDTGIKEGDTVSVKILTVENTLGSWVLTYEKVKHVEITEDTIVDVPNEQDDEINGLSEEEVAAEEQDNASANDSGDKVDNNQLEKEPEDSPSNVASKEDKEDINIEDQVSVNAIPTADGTVCLFITNNSEVQIGDIDVTICFYDEDGNILDSDSDGHDAVLPSYTVVSQMDAPSSYAYYEIDLDIDEKCNSDYVNHSDKMDVIATPASGGGKMIVQITNNDDVSIDEVEVIIIMYEGDKIVQVVGPRDFYDIESGDTDVEEMYMYPQNYDSYEVYINQAHTFG